MQDANPDNERCNRLTLNGQDRPVALSSSLFPLHHKANGIQKPGQETKPDDASSLKLLQQTIDYSLAGEKRN